jgi:uncharacterized protein (UPF0548 family)
VTIEQLSGGEAAVLRAAPFSYDRAAIEEGRIPPGYERMQASRQLTRTDFDRAVNDLLCWRAQAGAGLGMRASDIPLVAGSVVLLRFGVGPAAVTARCRVLEVIDEPSRKGFAYGSLPGHPESGAEEFVLEQDAEGRIRFTVTSVSKPATLLARASGPIGRMMQRYLTSRYLRALDHL